MKTKKVSRVLALLLSLVMLLGALPMTALAETDAVISDEEYDRLLRQAVETFYNRIIETDNLADFDSVSMEITDEQGLEFIDQLSEEQRSQLTERVGKLIEEFEEATKTPADEKVEEEPDNREIIYPTKNYTNAAGFGSPVEGRAPAARMMMFASRASSTDDGLVVSKRVSEPSTNGVYTLTLEAWATGSKVTTEQVTSIPTDIVLVLDQSGSMDQNFSSTTTATYNSVNSNATPSNLYSYRSNLYVKRSDGSYAPVTVSRNSVQTGGNYQAYPNQYNETYYDARDRIYHLCEPGKYGKVTISRERYAYPRVYTYTCANGCTLDKSEGRYEVPSFHNSLYQYSTDSDNWVSQYTFTYTDVDGTSKEATVLESESIPSWEFYRQETSTTSTTKLNALKTAVTNFASAVAEKAKGADGILGNEDDVDHTISVVGFASGGYYGYQNYNYGNTEVFVGGQTYKYGSSATSQYGNVPQDMSTTTGVNNVTASINALDADGGTIIDLGVEMAAGILEANPVPAGAKRNRVVIIFTDGIPGWSGYDSTVASNAITESNSIKSTYGATVYTVGVFNGADATKAGSTGNGSSDADKGNYFMQRLSSNTSYPQTPSYYLSAGDSAALNNIFQTISENIESGGSFITLDEDTVVKDVLTDQFELPAGASINDIKVYTANCTAADTFGDRETYAATVSISEDGKSVSVTNFDYAENWVGSETAANGQVSYRGKKLIIEIPIVVRSGFLGGNGVLTNAAGSGVYEDSDAETAVKEFTSPSVNVPIHDQSISVMEKNVYLNGTLTQSDLLAGATIYPLDVYGNPVTGSMTWQDDYATVSVQNPSDKGGLLDDTTYTVTLKVTPLPDSTVSSVGTVAQEKPATATGNINVFKPELTFKDGQVDYMSAIDGAKYLYNNTEKTYEVNNRDGNAVWKHGETVATNMGNPPALSLAYNPTSGVVNNNVTSTTYVPMQVTVKIGDTPVTEHVTFKHTETCPDTACEWESVTKTSKGNPAFLLHVENVNGDLKITKTVNWNGKYDEAQTFLFKVEGTKVNGGTIDPIWVSIDFTYSDGTSKSTTITIEDLPAGTYTVTEIPADQRYTMSAEGNTGMVVNGTVIPEAKFTNTLNNDKWLDDEHSVDNIFNDVTTQESTN